MRAWTFQVLGGRPLENIGCKYLAPLHTTHTVPAGPPPAFDPPVNSVSNEPLLERPQVLTKKSERGQKRNRKQVHVDENFDRELACLDSQLKEVSKPVQKSERQLYADSIVPSLSPTISSLLQRIVSTTTYSSWSLLK